MFRNVCLLYRTFETDVVFVIAGPREAQWKTTIHTRRVSLNTPADLSPRMHSDACLLCLSLCYLESTVFLQPQISIAIFLSTVFLCLVKDDHQLPKRLIKSATETVKWVGPRKSQIK